MLQELLRRLIPGLLQGFVQGEKLHGSGGGAKEPSFVIADVEDKPSYVVRRKDAFRLAKKFFCIFGGKLKGEAKLRGRMLSLDKFQAERTKILPAGKMAGGKTELFLFLLGVEIRVETSVYMEGIVGGDAALHYEEGVEYGP